MASSDNLTRRGLMLILSSPSGAGKTTISRRLLAEERNLRMSVSVTTRPMRPGEIEGQDYFFTDRPSFDAMVAAVCMYFARTLGSSTPSARRSTTSMSFAQSWVSP